jgi:Head domain of trimeric autotransporter adhesin
MSHDKQLFSNNAVSLLSSPISATSTSLNVMTGAGALFPNPGVNEYFLITLEDQSSSTREIIRVTGRVGDTLTFPISGRGQEGSVPQAWSATLGNDTLVDHRVTAETMRLAMLLPDALLLDDIVNVIAPSPNVNDILKYNGTNWVNSASSSSNPTQLYAENPQIGVTTAISPGLNAVAIGAGSTAQANNSIAIGEQSLSRLSGSYVHANGRFGSQGDAQTGKYLLRTHSTSATPTELFIDGTAGSSRLLIPDDSTVTFTATVVAHQTNGNGHAGFVLKGVIYKLGAINTLILGSVSKETLSNPFGWNVLITADNVNHSLKTVVTGQTGKTIRWLSIVETVEITN